jgi:hypothetical protein
MADSAWYVTGRISFQVSDIEMTVLPVDQLQCPPACFGLFTNRSGRQHRPASDLLLNTQRVAVKH